MVFDLPETRWRVRNDAPLRPDRDFVLYWMIGARRARDNFGLQRALWHAHALHKALVVFEPLRCGYRWASDRLHRFVLDGMADNQRDFQVPGVTYLPYIEPAPGAGRGLLEALAARACVVVTDHAPGFFLPRMVSAAATRLQVRLEDTDSNGILPLFAAPRVFTTAASFRRHLQKTVRPHLDALPLEHPLLKARLPQRVELSGPWLQPWFPEGGRSHDPSLATLSSLPIDHSVQPVDLRGGARSAHKRWLSFLSELLVRYPEERNQPQREVTTGLSPYLHFGHIGVHAMVRSLLAHEGWDASKLPEKASGSRAGWWKMSAPAEAFIDQLLTWRELGFTFCHLRPDDYHRYESLPAWALETLEVHARDPRPHVYSLDALRRAETHDPLWNAAQAQLLEQGRMHNYLRMLWGKKILEWSEHPRAALEALVELNNRYALDGRDPNSWSGIFWTLGRFDRAWGPERSIFGKIRYMSSENTARKVRVKEYVQRWS